jgi:hypothetical protein
MNTQERMRFSILQRTRAYLPLALACVLLHLMQKQHLAWPSLCQGIESPQPTYGRHQMHRYISRGASNTLPRNTRQLCHGDVHANTWSYLVWKMARLVARSGNRCVLATSFEAPNCR